MKQFIVLMATLILGVAIVNLIAGPAPTSTYNVVKQLWTVEIQNRSNWGMDAE